MKQKYKKWIENGIPILIPKLIKDFSKVRESVKKAVEASPRSISFEEALKQIKSFNE